MTFYFPFFLTESVSILTFDSLINNKNQDAMFTCKKCFVQVANVRKKYIAL